MKASELILMLESHPDDDVVVKLAKPSIGRTASADIEKVYSGFDWDKGRTLLKASVDLVPKTDDEHIWEMARDLLMWLATKPVKNASYEVRTARRILERKGIDFMKYQHIFHREAKP